MDYGKTIMKTISKNAFRHLNISPLTTYAEIDALSPSETMSDRDKASFNYYKKIAKSAAHNQENLLHVIETPEELQDLLSISDLCTKIKMIEALLASPGTGEIDTTKQMVVGAKKALATRFVASTILPAAAASAIAVGAAVGGALYDLIEKNSNQKSRLEELICNSRRLQVILNGCDEPTVYSLLSVLRKMPHYVDMVDELIRIEQPSEITLSKDGLDYLTSSTMMPKRQVITAVLPDVIRDPVHHTLSWLYNINTLIEQLAFGSGISMLESELITLVNEVADNHIMDAPSMLDSSMDNSDDISFISQVFGNLSTALREALFGAEGETVQKHEKMSMVMSTFEDIKETGSQDQQESFDRYKEDVSPYFNGQESFCAIEQKTVVDTESRKKAIDSVQVFCKFLEEANIVISKITKLGHVVNFNDPTIVEINQMVCQSLGGLITAIQYINPDQAKEATCTMIGIIKEYIPNRSLSILFNALNQAKTPLIASMQSSFTTEKDEPNRELKNILVEFLASEYHAITKRGQELFKRKTVDRTKESNLLARLVEITEVLAKGANTDFIICSFYITHVLCEQELNPVSVALAHSAQAVLSFFKKEVQLTGTKSTQAFNEMATKHAINIDETKEESVKLKNKIILQLENPLSSIEMIVSQNAIEIMKVISVGSNLSASEVSMIGKGPQ